VLIGAAVTTMALVLAGCSSHPGTSNSPAPPDSLDVAIPTDVSPSNLLGILSANEPVGRLVLETLADYDDSTNKVVPMLATSWQMAPDRLSMKVTLRDGVKFHSGRAFGADDVVFSAQAAEAPDSGAQVGTLLKGASKIEATGPLEVTFTFPSPMGDYFQDVLLLMKIVDKDTYADLKSGKSVVGTGPYVWKSWTPGDSVQLVRNDAYWQTGKPAIKNVTLRVVSQSQAALAALRSGQSGVAMRMVPRDINTLKGDQQLTVTSYSPFSEVYLGVDVTVAPFNDLRVRQALAWALDRQRISDQVFSGFAQPTSLPFSPTAAGMSAIGDTSYGYDVAKAKSLLAQAGAINTNIKLSVLATDPILAAVRDIVTFNLTEIGFNVTPVAWDGAAVASNLGAGTTGGLWINRVSSGSLSPASMTSILLPYRPSKNASNLSDPAYTQLVTNSTSGTADANQALAQYIINQAFHLTVARVEDPLVTSSSLSGIKLDANGYLDLVDAK
jgi:peptide/nickel transport system substrate-binding protein